MQTETPAPPRINDGPKWLTVAGRLDGLAPAVQLVLANELERWAADLRRRAQEDAARPTSPASGGGG